MMVSIITPTYNSEKFILETADSILKQSFSNWEWIVVDDASKDNTIKLIESIGDARIKTIQLEPTNNPAKSRNIGFAASRGDLIVLLDHDDIFTPDKLEKQVQFMKDHPKVASVHTETKVLVNDTGELIDREMRKPLDTSLILDAQASTKELLNGNYIYLSSFAVRRAALEAINGFTTDPAVWSTNDFDLYLKLAENDYQMGFIATPLLYYRKLVQSMSSDKTRNLNNVLHNIDLAVKRAPHHYQNFKEEIAYFKKRTHFKKGIQLLKKKDPSWRKEVRPFVRLQYPSWQSVKWIILLSLPTTLVHNMVKRISISKSG